MWLKLYKIPNTGMYRPIVSISQPKWTVFYKGVFRPLERAEWVPISNYVIKI